jgi:hypothetical protein
MGWTFGHRPKGITDLAYFRNEFDWDKGQVVDASRRGMTVYLAYLQKDSGLTFAIVCLTRWVRDSDYNFGYKDMDEFMGPYVADCPRRILEQLSPLESWGDEDKIAYAREWRARAWAHERRRQMAPQIKVGRILRVPYLVPFSTGKRHDIFLITDGRRLRGLPIVPDKDSAGGATQLFVSSTVHQLNRGMFAAATDVTEEVMPQITNRDRVAQLLGSAV